MRQMAKDYRSEFVKEVTINEIELAIDGYFTLDGKCEWYDVFHRGICVNEGEPFDRMPTKAQLKKIAQIIRKEYIAGKWTV